MKKQTTSSAVEPVDALMGIFTVRRDLLEPMRQTVLRNIELTLDEADSLVTLFGLHVMGWTDAPVDSEGFVKVSDLRSALVLDPGYLSRRIEEFRRRGLIKIKRSARRRAYVEAVKISDSGAEVAKVIWLRYKKLAEHLLEGVSPADLQAHCRVNVAINATIKRLNQPVLLTLMDGN